MGILKFNKKGESQDEKEKCVLCGGETEYLWSDPITIRKHYIEGCGQVCERCFIKLKHSELDESV